MVKAINGDENNLPVTEDPFCTSAALLSTLRLKQATMERL